jgi:hypothetical protein
VHTTREREREKKRSNAQSWRLEQLKGEFVDKKSNEKSICMCLPAEDRVTSNVTPEEYGKCNLFELFAFTLSSENRSKNTDANWREQKKGSDFGAEEKKKKKKDEGGFARFTKQHLGRLSEKPNHSGLVRVQTSTLFCVRTLFGVIPLSTEALFALVFCSPPMNADKHPTATLTVKMNLQPKKSAFLLQVASSLGEFRALGTSRFHRYRRLSDRSNRTNYSFD